jgi:hypothetical protein
MSYQAVSLIIATILVDTGAELFNDITFIYRKGVYISIMVVRNGVSDGVITCPQKSISANAPDAVNASRYVRPRPVSIP